MLKSRFLQSGCIFRVFSTVYEPVCAGTQECRNTGTPAGAVPLSGCERLSARGIRFVCLPGYVPLAKCTPSWGDYGALA